MAGTRDRVVAQAFPLQLPGHDIQGTGLDLVLEQLKSSPGREAAALPDGIPWCQHGPGLPGRSQVSVEVGLDDSYSITAHWGGPDFRGNQRSPPGAPVNRLATRRPTTLVGRARPGDDERMKLMDDPEVHSLLQEIVEFELAGVIRFTHYALMVTGPNRIPIVDFFKEQASESLLHAQRAGEILTGLGGHPSMAVAPMDETHEHGVAAILQESYTHERAAIEKYYRLVELVEGQSVFLEEYARSMVAAEEEHVMELKKMMRDLEA